MEASEMTREQKIEWMAVWAAKNGCALALEGEVGIGRPCVGILVDGNYPDYHWYAEKTYERCDPNGEVFAPRDAYHKHDCVAVLGRGEEAETQLFEWLTWFDDRGFKVTSNMDAEIARDPIRVMMGQHNIVRIQRKPE